MVDRHWIGDFAFAILLALPLAVLVRPEARPEPDRHHVAPIAAKLTTADRLAGTGRISLLS